MTPRYSHAVTDIVYDQDIEVVCIKPPTTTTTTTTSPPTPNVTSKLKTDVRSHHEVNKKADKALYFRSIIGFLSAIS